jgi:N-acetylmuramic acid 6-phosphate etherase
MNCSEGTAAKKKSRPPRRVRRPDAVRSLRLPTTEQRNPRSANLDRLSVGAAVELMLTEEARMIRVLLAKRALLSRAVTCVARAFRRGGRLFYVGAGTSGRLGVLDASECPPTFRTPPTMVQGIIAGGEAALRRAVEGAEDDAAAGGREIRSRGAGPRDVVVGIAASGTTPFVWGALRAARRRGATTVLLCFNQRLSIPEAWRPDLVIAPEIGPEVLTGSTRLKAGTATKLVLNLLTTLAMVRIGKVKSNLMVDVMPGNAKLRARAVRIVRELTGMEEAAARDALVRNGWVIKAACRRSSRTRRSPAP